MDQEGEAPEEEKEERRRKGERGRGETPVEYARALEQYTKSWRNAQINRKEKSVHSNRLTTPWGNMTHGCGPLTWLRQSLSNVRLTPYCLWGPENQVVASPPFFPKCL